MLPINFGGCGLSGADVRGSHYIPTPDAPLTPNHQFYVNSNFGTPGAAGDTQRWRLHLRGLVDRERTLSYDDLLALPQIRRGMTLECVGNEPGGDLISSAEFTGPSLRDVLATAGVDDHARGLYFVGLDGYPSFLPVDVAASDRALVVHTMNGDPLPLEHGAPVRVLFPDRYGMYSVKWLDSITATRTWHTYGALRGLSDTVDGIKRVRSRVDAPRAGRTVIIGEPVTVTGLAVSAGTGITRIEVKNPESDRYEPAEITFNTLTDEHSPLLWSLFRYTYTPSIAGAQLLSVRAFDGDGDGQVEDRRFPYDASAIHTVRIVVRS
jgi:DMSO/TMAO reductase YedYZ molybdopterin-dependent catalytic subunit